MTGSRSVPTPDTVAGSAGGSRRTPFQALAFSRRLLNQQSSEAVSAIESSLYVLIHARHWPEWD